MLKKYNFQTIGQRRQLFVENSENEICQSLLRFIETSNNNAESVQHISMAAVMEEFASNGYSCDEPIIKDATKSPNVSNFSSVKVKDRNFNLAFRKQNKRYNKTEKYPSQHCVFCENNNEPEAVVKSHAVRDIFGKVLCPKLRTYICPICKASGDIAHTVKYCPQKPIITIEDTIRLESFRLARASFFPHGILI